jgi:hypothetical protein
LSDLIQSLEQEWGIAVGKPHGDASKAFVAQAELADASQAVLKLVVPQSQDGARREATVRHLLDGNGCARLLRADPDRRALPGNLASHPVRPGLVLGRLAGLLAVVALVEAGGAVRPSGPTQ